jgi:hypothetical protein
MDELNILPTAHSTPTAALAFIRKKLFGAELFMQNVERKRPAIL